MDLSIIALLAQGSLSPGHLIHCPPLAHCASSLSLSDFCIVPRRLCIVHDADCAIRNPPKLCIPHYALLDAAHRAPFVNAESGTIVQGRARGNPTEWNLEPWQAVWHRIVRDLHNYCAARTHALWQSVTIPPVVELLGYAHRIHGNTHTVRLQVHSYHDTDF